MRANEEAPEGASYIRLIAVRACALQTQEPLNVGEDLVAAPPFLYRLVAVGLVDDEDLALARTAHCSSFLPMPQMKQ